MRIPILYLAATALLVISCKDDRETFVVKKQDLVEAVYSSVLLEPYDYYAVKSTVTGYLDQIHINEGDELKNGQALFTIRDLSAKNTAENADLAYRLAQSNLNSDQSILNDIRLEMGNLKLKLKNDSINLARNKSLYEKGALSKVELEQAELQLASAKAAYEASKNRYNRTKTELKTMKDQASNNFKLSVSRVGDALITSIMDGKVYSILKEKGDLITLQEPIAVIGSSNEFKIKLLIDEGDIAKVEKGQEVIVKLEAYPGKYFEAEVIRISQKMDDRTQTFEVLATFRETPKKLFMGLTGEASIVVKEQKEALVIPNSYINEKGEVETAEGYKKVKIGVRSLSKVEIIKGLKEGDVIYKPEN
jgi:multidrug efflux pump subunit AcrA (membrane-fusion protein)